MMSTLVEEDARALEDFLTEHLASPQKDYLLYQLFIWFTESANLQVGIRCLNKISEDFSLYDEKITVYLPTDQYNANEPGLSDVTFRDAKFQLAEKIQALSQNKRVILEPLVQQWGIQHQTLSAHQALLEKVTTVFSDLSTEIGKILALHGPKNPAGRWIQSTFFSNRKQAAALQILLDELLNQTETEVRPYHPDNHPHAFISRASTLIEQQLPQFRERSDAHTILKRAQETLIEIHTDFNQLNVAADFEPRTHDYDKPPETEAPAYNELYRGYNFRQ